MPNRRTDGAKIAELRQTQGHRQRGFALMCGLSAGHLREIEKGRAQPSIVTLHRIANGLGVSIDEFSSPTEPADEAGAA